MQFPEMSPSEAGRRYELIDLSDDRWSVEALARSTESHLSGESVNDEGCSWPPVVSNRVLPRRLLDFRVNLIECAKQFGYPTDRPDEKGLCDKECARVMWRHFGCVLTDGQAATGGIWRWLSIGILPDLVAWRWRGAASPPSRHRFVSTGDLRCWPMHLWWYAWLCATEEGLDERMLEHLSPADARAGVLERTGGGFDRNLIRSIFAEIDRLAIPSAKRESLLRGILLRVTWVRSTKAFSVLNESELERQARELAAWSLRHYKKRETVG